MPEDELAEILRVCDSDGNGVIDYTEFITATINRDSILSEEKLKQAFKLFDLDGSGTITMSELTAVLGISEDMNAVFLEADENADGNIDFNEF
jgi:calcium-dependent protein kinase